jgi:hypothetical protein
VAAPDAARGGNLEFHGSLRPEAIASGDLQIADSKPSVHPILEDFKLMHRAIDVKKVQAEVRKLEMENVRYAARILSGEREARVGWVEAIAETHHNLRHRMMGFALLYPSYNGNGGKRMEECGSPVDRWSTEKGARLTLFQFNLP